MEFKEYIEKYKQHFQCGSSCEDEGFLEYLEELYDPHTSYFPKVRLRKEFQTHKQWNGVCQALRDIPDSYGVKYGFWNLINDKGYSSPANYPIEWFEFLE